MKKKLSGKYLKIFLSFAIILTVSIASFNIFFDSYGYFESRYGIKSNVSSENKNKIERIFKIYEVERYKPDLAIMGTSRTGVGISDESINRILNLKSYNISFNDANLYEIFHFLNYLHQEVTTKKYIIFIDAFQFVDDYNNNRDFNIGLISTKSAYIKYISKIKEELKHLYAFNIFSNNLKTVYSEFKDPSRIKSPFHDKLKSKGFYSMNKTTIETYNNGLTLSKKDFFKENDKLNIFKKILDYAMQHNIDVTFVISPISSDLLDMYNEKNEFSSLLKWKTFLTKEIYAHNQNKNFKLWDFAYYNKYTTSIRKNTDTEIKGYYWEASHYTKELGDIIITQIYGDKSKYNPAVNDLYHSFGLNLTPENVDAYVNEMKKEAVKYYRPLNQNPSLKKSDIIINQS